MASACHDLLCLVLQRIDRHPIGDVDGVEIERFSWSALDALLAHRILVQRSPLDELDGRPVQWLGGKPFLFDPESECPPEEIDPRLLIAYEIDLSALCGTLRRANQLVGPPMEELSDRAYFLGHRGGGRRRRSLCLARLLHDSNVLDTLYLLRGHIAAGQLVLLTPNVVELRRPTLRSLAAENAVIVPLPEALATSNSAEPFSLNTPVQIDTDADALASARFRLDTGNKIATLDDSEVSLTPREFDVLVALANEAKGDGGFVARDDLLTIIEVHRRDHEEAAPGDLENTISRTRRALTTAAGLPPQQGTRIIQARRKGGYRLRLAELALEPSDVVIF
jgi:DNA-binding winged helix-turn-helix (wHTH) protein